MAYRRIRSFTGLSSLQVLGCHEICACVSFIGAWKLCLGFWQQDPVRGYWSCWARGYLGCASEGANGFRGVVFRVLLGRGVHRPDTRRDQGLEVGEFSHHVLRRKHKDFVLGSWLLDLALLCRRRFLSLGLRISWDSCSPCLVCGLCVEILV